MLDLETSTTMVSKLVYLNKHQFILPHLTKVYIRLYKLSELVYLETDEETGFTPDPIQPDWDNAMFYVLGYYSNMDGVTKIQVEDEGIFNSALMDQVLIHTNQVTFDYWEIMGRSLSGAVGLGDAVVDKYLNLFLN